MPLPVLVTPMADTLPLGFFHWHFWLRRAMPRMDLLWSMAKGHPPLPASPSNKCVLGDATHVCAGDLREKQF